MPLELETITFPNPSHNVAELMKWSDHFASLADSTPARRFSFRGQPQEFRNLEPSFKRQFLTSMYGAAELIERDLIRAFRDHYDRLPDRSADMPLPGSLGEGYDLRCLSLMQHYEVPTRLLDWTMDFWTAVYFACASDPSSNGEVWLYDRGIFAGQLQTEPDLALLLNPGTSATPEPPLLARKGEPLLAELDPSLTARMRMQAAHHTISTNVFADHADLLAALAKSAATERDDPFYFRRLVIEKSCKSNTLRFLAEYKDITASTIFPDVVGLGRFLRWHLDSLRTMLL